METFTLKFLEMSAYDRSSGFTNHVSILYFRPKQNFHKVIVIMNQTHVLTCKRNSYKHWNGLARLNERPGSGEMSSSDLLIRKNLERVAVTSK